MSEIFTQISLQSKHRNQKFNNCHKIDLTYPQEKLILSQKYSFILSCFEQSLVSKLKDIIPELKIRQHDIFRRGFLQPQMQQKQGSLTRCFEKERRDNQGLPESTQNTCNAINTGERYAVGVKTKVLEWQIHTDFSSILSIWLWLSDLKKKFGFLCHVWRNSIPQDIWR